MDLDTAFYWLALGAGLQLFGFGRWMTPVAPWLVPVFLLHFSHNMPMLSGMLWIWVALTIVFGISLRGVVPIPGLVYLVLPVTWGLTAALPFAFAKLVGPLLPSFSATLAFPLAWTAVEFLVARRNPYGSWGAIGSTQHGVLPLMQLASVTGIWGIGFVMCWFAAVVNWAWEQQFAWESIQKGVLIFSGITFAIL